MPLFPVCSPADQSRYVREAVLGRLMQASYTNGVGEVASLGAPAGPRVASLDNQAMALGYDDKSFTAAALHRSRVSGPTPSVLGVISTVTVIQRSRTAIWVVSSAAWTLRSEVPGAQGSERAIRSPISASMRGIARPTWRASISPVTPEAWPGPLRYRSGGAWAWNEIDTSFRAVLFPGFFEREKANYDADTGQIFGEIAYPTTMGSLAAEPFAGLAFVSVNGDHFHEHGGSLAALNGDGDENVGYSTLGLRAAVTTHWGSTLVTPHASIAWQHAFDDVTPGASSPSPQPASASPFLAYRSPETAR